MINPTSACLLATIVALIAGFIAAAFVPHNSLWILAVSASGFIGSLAFLGALGLREL